MTHRQNSTDFSENPRHDSYDAIVVGSGPNGLAAAIRLAQAGLGVVVFEAAETIGGGMRSKTLTLPGFTHDVCSSVHPLGVSSPFFRSLPLDHYGLEWIYPPASLAHPLDNGSAVMLERSIEKTAAKLGSDTTAYSRLFKPLVADAEKLFFELLGPLRIPKYPMTLARFGRHAFRSAIGLVGKVFQNSRAAALFGGNAAHSFLPLETPLTAAVGLMLTISGHASGWPIAKGGSQTIANAMAGYLRSLGAEVVCRHPVRSVEELPQAKLVLFDVGPPALAEIASSCLPEKYQAKLRGYRYGPGAFKLDWALSEPIPWKDPECLRAALVHVGGSFDEVAAAERACWRGENPERPFVLVSQQSLFDSSRAPAGKHTGWAYCHVPYRSTADMTARIEAQIERFAPGFRDCILARHSMSTADLELYNANYVGGDIIGGVQDIRQLFTRPTARLVPYSTPSKALFICSSSTPPGAGVHGMCGYFAAEAALQALC